MSNRIILNEESAKERANSKVDTSVITDRIKRVADFDFSLSREMIIRQIPFMLFICLLIAVSIWNGHKVEKLIRNTDKLNKENKELRSEYINTLSGLMNESRQSVVARRLSSVQLNESKKPPIKITTDGN